MIQIPRKVLGAASALGAEQDAAVFWYSGRMSRDLVKAFYQQYAIADQRTNCALFLTTYGGDADAAYILARFLRRAYKRVAVYVLGHCKSAGTLVCIGANEIVMGPFGELGPLDIQLSKDDSLAARSSGLDIFQALTIISNQAFDIFQRTFLGIVGGSGGVITTKTAADIATAVASNLLTPITAQIDPLRLGEMQRALTVARDYGIRLGGDADTVVSLATDYSAHGFVIDIDEAKDLFPGIVRIPNETELSLEAELRAFCLKEMGVDCVDTEHESGVVSCLTPALAHQREIDFDADEREAGGESDDGSTGSTPREPVREIDAASERPSSNNGTASKPDVSAVPAIQRGSAAPADP